MQGTTFPGKRLLSQARNNLLMQGTTFPGKRLLSQARNNLSRKGTTARPKDNFPIMEFYNKNAGQKRSATKMALSGRTQREQFIASIIKDGDTGGGPPCRFTPKELDQIIQLFKELAGPNLRIKRATFLDQLQEKFRITDSFLMNRIFRTFDNDNDGAIRIDEYIWGLSAFVRGTKEDKMKFCFQCYNLNGNGYISKDEMAALLKKSVVRSMMDSTDEDPEESCRELADIMFKKLDVNHDGLVDFPDFREAVYTDFLLMEALGQCLPLREAAEAFVAYLNS